MSRQKKTPPDLERYCASYRTAEAPFSKPFLTKGLAFAFARREAPKVVEGMVTVEHQVLAPGAIDWKVVEAWEFTADGRGVRTVTPERALA